MKFCVLIPVAYIRSDATRAMLASLDSTGASKKYT